MAEKNKDLIPKTVHSLIQSVKTVFLMQGAVCKYEPSCSKYAEEAIRTLPLATAVIKIIWRVLRCNPFSRGGYDPVSLTDNQVKGA
ncbi:MAG: membrane protein insertion efficiency factor YidD [Chitinispirillaceae bacterium]